MAKRDKKRSPIVNKVNLALFAQTRDGDVCWRKKLSSKVDLIESSGKHDSPDDLWKQTSLVTPWNFPQASQKVRSSAQKPLDQNERILSGIRTEKRP